MFVSAQGTLSRVHWQEQKLHGVRQDQNLVNFYSYQVAVDVAQQPEM